MNTQPATPSPRTPNPVRRARTREAILDAAEAQFVANGFAATTIDRLVPLAGVSKGAIYFHFTSKEDLLHALLQRSRDELFEPALARLSASELTAGARIVGYFNWVGTLQQLNRYLLPVLLSVQGDAIGEATRAEIAAFSSAMQTGLADAVRAGQHSGEFTSSARPEELAAIIQALMEGMLLQWHRSPAGVDGAEFLRVGRHALLGALGTAATR